MFCLGGFFMSDRVPFTPDSEPELTSKPVSINREEGLSFLDYSSYHRMCDFLRINDIDRKDHKIAEKINSVTEWARGVSKSNNEITHLRLVKGLLKDLGISNVGIDLLDRLNRYVRLDEEKRDLENEMELYKETPEEKSQEQENIKLDIQALKRQIEILSEGEEKAFE